MADPLEARSLGDAQSMLQRIFLAVLCGVAAGLIGKYLELVKDLFEAFNDLFLKMTALIIKVDRRLTQTKTGQGI